MSSFVAPAWTVELPTRCLPCGVVYPRSVIFLSIVVHR